MNPDTNRFEELLEAEASHDDRKKLRADLAREAAGGSPLVRPDGSPVPSHWSTFTMGEEVVIKNYTFRVAYIGETSILFEPVGVPVLTKEE